MADQTFHLKYKIEGDASGMRVANRELEKTDKAVDNLAKGKGLTGLLSGISGVATGSQLNGLTSQITSASSALGSIPGPAGAAAGAIALVGTAAVGLGVALFHLTTDTAEYGSTLKDASDQTGLAAETLSAMKLAADQSGSSIEQITGAVGKFSKTVGDAALGSDEAAAKMKRLGIDPQKAIKDLDGALSDVFKRIVALPPGVTQSKAAMDAFGKSGADLLPFIKQFNGDLPALIKHAEELGIVWSQKDVNAADDFGDQMAELKLQLKGVGYTIGKELMPTFLGMARDVSGWLSQNKGEVASWARFIQVNVNTTAMVLRGAISGLRTFAAETRDWLTSLEVQGIPVGRIVGAYLGGESIGDKIAGIVPKVPETKTPMASDDYLNNLKAQKDAADKARKEREELQKRTDAAQIQTLKNYLDEAKRLYDETLEGLREQFQQTGDADAFLTRAAQALDQYGDFAYETLDRITEAEDRQDEHEKKIEAERVVRRQEQKKRADENQAEMDKSVKENNKLVADSAKKASDDQIKAAKATSDQLIALAESVADADIAAIEYRMAVGNETVLRGLAERQSIEKKALENRLVELEKERKLVAGNADELKRVNNEIAILNNQIAGQSYAHAVEKANTVLAEGNKILGEINDKIQKGEKQAKDLADALEKAFSDMAKAQKDAFDKSFVGGFFGATGMEAITSEADYIKSVYADMGAFVGDIVTGMAQGVGQMVEAWVLYGELGPDALRKMTAQVLASVAAEAAVRAIMELAYGFASLWLNPAEAATHFKAAALFGAVAVTTGLAGRAVAGDSFKKGATGGQGTSSTGSRGTQTPATYTRTTPDAYISGNRSEAQLVAAAVEKLNARLDSMKPGEVLTTAIRQNRGLIIKTVHSEAGAFSSEAQGIVKRAGIK